MNLIKTFLSFLSILAFISLIPLQQAKAQQMKLWKWTDHNVNFRLPSTWTIKKSSKTYLIAKGPHDVTILIRPWKASQTTDPKSVAMQGYKTYTVVKERRITMQKYLDKGDSGLNRYVIFGEGKSSKTRSPIYFGIIGLHNPTTNSNLYARFWWFKKYNSEFNDLTYKIATSFKIRDKNKTYIPGSNVSQNSSGVTTMKPWVWKEHRVKFQLPSDWNVKRSTAQYFIAKGPHDVTILIRPVKIASSDPGSVAREGFHTYTVVKERKILQQKPLVAGSSGMQRYIIFGEGKSSKTRSPVYFGIIGLINPNTGSKLYARFWWFKKYDNIFGKKTFEIANSFNSY